LDARPAGWRPFSGLTGVPDRPLRRGRKAERADSLDSSGSIPRRAASKRTGSIPALEDPRTLLRPGFIARPQPAVIESAGSDALPADGMARIVGGRSPQADKSAREIAMCLKRRGSFVTIGLEFRGLPAYGGAWFGRRLVLHDEHDESQRARRGRKAFPLREGRVPGATAGLTARGKWGHTPLSLPGRTARRRK